MLILYFLIIPDTIKIGLKSTSLIVNNIAIRYTANKSGSYLN
jgi:hypothetical protein